MFLWILFIEFVQIFPQFFGKKNFNETSFKAVKWKKVLAVQAEIVPHLRGEKMAAFFERFS